MDGWMDGWRWAGQQFCNEYILLLSDFVWKTSFSIARPGWRSDLLSEIFGEKWRNYRGAKERWCFWVSETIRGCALLELIAQCLISACANDPLGGGKNTSGIWVLLLLSHEISVSFCSFFSLILSGGCTLAFQDFFIQLITKPVVTSAL